MTSPLVWKLKTLASKGNEISFPPLQFSIIDEEGKCTFLQLNIHKYMDANENGVITFSENYDSHQLSALWVPRNELEALFYYQVASLFPKEYVLFLVPTSFFGLQNTLPEYCFMRNPFILPLFRNFMSEDAFEEACLSTFTNFAKYVQLCFRQDVCFSANAVQFDEGYGFGIFPLRAQQDAVSKQNFILSWRKRMQFIWSMKIKDFIEFIKEEKRSLSPLLSKLLSVLSLMGTYDTETEDTARALVKYAAEVLECYTNVNILDIFAKKSAKHMLLKKKQKKVRFQKKVIVKLF
jgi:hypothetical protein